jgi:hypothetical protein
LLNIATAFIHSVGGVHPIIKSACPLYPNSNRRTDID